MMITNYTIHTLYNYRSLHHTVEWLLHIMYNIKYYWPLKLPTLKYTSAVTLRGRTCLCHTHKEGDAHVVYVQVCVCVYAAVRVCVYLSWVCICTHMWRCSHSQQVWCHYTVSKLWFWVGTSPCKVTHVKHTPLGRVFYLSTLAVNALPRVSHYLCHLC